MNERGGHHVGKAEAGLGRGCRIGISSDLECLAIGLDAHSLDVTCRDIETALKRQRGIDSRENVTAARVVLERDPRNMELASERGQRLVPIRPVAHGVAEASIALDYVERSGHAFACSKGREQTAFGRAAGVERLRHRVHSERLLEPGGKRRSRCERVRELLSIES